MGILDDLTPPAPRQWTCIVKTTSEKLEAADRKKFDEAMSNGAWKAEPLAGQLQKLGINISASTIRNHRKGLCSCSRT